MEHSQIFINEMQATFNLREPKASKPTNIYLVVRMNGKQVKLSIGAKVYPCQWNKDKQEAYLSYRLSELDNRNNEIANSKINETKICFLEYKKYLCENPNLIDDGISILRERIYKGINKRMGKKQDISATNQMLLLTTEQDIKESSKHTKCKHIKDFSKYLKESAIKDEWNEINLNTIKSYQIYLIDKGLRYATIENKLNCLISILRVASKRSDIPFKWSESNLDSFEIVKNKTNKSKVKDKQVALTIEQVKKIYSYKAKSELDEEVKDMFVLQCLVGQRISDMPKLLNGEYEIKDNTISIIQQKTGEKAIVPLFNEAKEILSKYNDGLKYPNILDRKKNANINRRIKEICKEVGLDELVEYQEQKGTEVITIRKPMYELIHTHTARHSFITIMCRMNIPKDTIIIATGHSNTAMIDKVYEHLNDKDKANKIEQAISEAVGSSLFDSSNNKKLKEKPNSLYEFGKAFAKQEQEHQTELNELNTKLEKAISDAQKKADIIFKMESDKDRFILKEQIRTAFECFYRENDLIGKLLDNDEDNKVLVNYITKSSPFEPKYLEFTNSKGKRMRMKYTIAWEDRNIQPTIKYKVYEI